MRGALVYGFLPSAFGWTSRRMTNLRTCLVAKKQSQSFCNFKVRERGFPLFLSIETHVIFLAQPEHPPDLCRPLWTQSLRVHGIRKTRNITLTLLDNRQRQHCQIGSNNTTPNTLSLALSVPSGSVARLTSAEEEANTRRMHDTLLHGESLFVVTAGDLEDVAFELVAHAVAGDLVAHAAVHEDAEFAVLIDLDELLGPIRWVGYV